MTAHEILALAERAGVGPGVSVLDACCGAGGPGRLLVRELGCDYLGLDAGPHERAGDLRIITATVPPLPDGPFDVVLVLETMLAFEDKGALVRAVADSLRPGGRFAFTLEEGEPLTPEEREAMPDADTVWPIPLRELERTLEQAGLDVVWHEDHSRSHRAMAQALERAHAAHGRDELVASHCLWIRWLGEGRVRKLAVVAVRR
jgi:SAM-dependent methyltransferase